MEILHPQPSTSTMSIQDSPLLQLLPLPPLSESLIKHEFINDFDSDEDDAFLTEDIKFPFSPNNTFSEVLESPKKVKNDNSRRNRRKAQMPQRAVQSKLSQSNSSEGNSPECSQDVPDPSPLEISLKNIDMIKNADMLKNTDILKNADLLESEPLEGSSDLLLSDSELPESEDLLRDIDEDNIFKGLQEEAENENFSEEMMFNVTEEMKVHWGVKCNRCEKVFTYKTEFDAHYIGSYGFPPMYTCTFCNKSAEKYSTFRSHCYRHITEGRHKCTICDKRFSLPSMLSIHIVSKHSDNKPFKCEECGKNFVTKPGLKIHLKKHKTETKEDYPCLICGKVLHTRGGLTSHINVHRLGQRFMCDICGKRFTQKVNMQQHAKQHTGDKPYACDKCNKTFAEKSHLARHYSFHSEERPFKCETCQKMYKTERCLKVHSLVHSNQRPFVCERCGKGFLSSTKLKQHINVHTGERPFECQYCERKFTNYPNWLKHTRRRHNVDHKTGETLKPKVQPPKEEPPATPNFVPMQQQQPIQEPQQQLQQQQTTPLNLQEVSFDIGIDLNTLKTEDLFLQQQNHLLDFTPEERLLLQQDIFAYPSNNLQASTLVPYLQNQLPLQQNIIHNGVNGLTYSQVQINEFIPTQLIQNAVSYN